MRVLAALSGGVDSAVAAARMVDAGHEVTGVHLALSRQSSPSPAGSRGCCSREDAHDARRVADVLDIPFYVWDVSQRFADTVVRDFLSEYAAGRTPNPCVRCNEQIKFSAVLEHALALGFDAVVTGHYARLAVGADGTATLWRAADPAKDQSYVLAVLRQEQLRHALFPLGGEAKPSVRAEAAERGLPVAAKPDSHDICFIPDGDTAGFLARALGEAPGDIVDAETGEILGRHRGVHAFTVGQRRGLALQDPSVDGRPRYVLGLSPVERTVTVGPRDHLAVGGVWTGPAVWCSARPALPLHAVAQYRAHGQVVPAVIAGARDGEQDDPPDGAALAVQLSVPQHGVAPGQTCAFYDGDLVLGSATIVGTWNA